MAARCVELWNAAARMSVGLTKADGRACRSSSEGRTIEAMANLQHGNNREMGKLRGKASGVLRRGFASVVVVSRGSERKRRRARGRGGSYIAEELELPMP